MNTTIAAETRPRFAENPYYVEYETQLKRLHELIAEGEGDSDAADALRDEMESPYRHLNSAEHDRLDGLSADLYMLQNDEVFEPATLQERMNLIPKLRAAFRNGDWVGLLSLLRKGPTDLAQHEIAHVRATAYARLEHTDTALQFVKYAAELSPSNMKYKGAVLGLALQVGKAAAFEELAHFCIQTSDDELVVMLAAYNLISVARREDDTAKLQELCSYVLTKLTLLDQRSDFGETSAETKASVYAVCAACRKILGQDQEAAMLLNQSVQYDPDAEKTYQNLVGDPLSYPDYVPKSILLNIFAVAAANPFAQDMATA